LPTDLGADLPQPALPKGRHATSHVLININDCDLRGRMTLREMYLWIRLAIALKRAARAVERWRLATEEQHARRH
jgi:hypothetical protein